jgi:hypothetical protein
MKLTLGRLYVTVLTLAALLGAAHLLSWTLAWIGV